MRVQGVARELGWRPDAVLHQQMASVRPSSPHGYLANIGVILHRPAVELATLPTIREHLNGVVERAQELGFGVNLFNMASEPLKARRLISILRARGIRGLVFVDMDERLDLEYAQLTEEFAAVSVGVDPGIPHLHVAISDYLSMTRRAINELRAAGYRRPGIVLPRGTENLLHWGLTGGFHACIADLPAEDRIPICYCGEKELFVPRWDFKTMHSWLDEHRPDVVLGIDTIGPAKVVAASTRYADVPIYSLDWHSGEGARGGIDQRPNQIGREAINMLLAHLQGGVSNERPLSQVVMVREAWVAC